MNYQENITASRRRFLKNGFKISGLAFVLIPFKKTLAAGTAIISKSIAKTQNFISFDKLVLNRKTGIVHLPTGKIFSKYPTIKRQGIISTTTWETDIKTPVHLVREKSGIILEILALTRLADGINDRTLTDAYRIISVAFSRTYNNKAGVLLNKYNFRLHHLLLQTISLNTTFASSQKWIKFQQATGNIDYSIQDAKPIPRFMGWLKSKAEFEKKVNYILQNRTIYTSRLADRASRYKL